MSDRLDLYTSVVPNERQKVFCESGYHAFIHFGMTTFTEKEWGDGKTEPSVFNPTNLDTDQWVSALKDGGAKGVILTCKHHDGFCLWQTDTTEYSIKNSPYKNGKGDIVKEVSESCKKFGMKFGVYLSPWDRNSEYYGTPKYNDFYIEQLTELLTRYGDIFCVWLDGACGSYLDGKAKQEYDFPRIYETVYKYQPLCAVSNCGPDVRWVGNEGGFARKSEWNVVPSFSFDLQNIADNSQQDANGEEMKRRCSDVLEQDLGSREFLSKYDSFIWYPAEVDVSIRPGWFYHKEQDKKIRSLDNLLNIYYTSVGGNSLLLLNVPPNKDGLFTEFDVARLKEFGEEIKKGTSYPVKIASCNAPKAAEGFEFNKIIEGTGTYSPEKESGSYEFVLKFENPELIDKVLLIEDCDFSQRIESFEIYTGIEGKEQKAVSGTTVGFRRYALFKKAVTADTVRIVITSCRKKPYLKEIKVLKAVGRLPKMPCYATIIKLGRKIGDYVYFKTEDYKNKKRLKKLNNPSEC